MGEEKDLKKKKKKKKRPEEEKIQRSSTIMKSFQKSTRKRARARAPVSAKILFLVLLLGAHAVSAFPWKRIWSWFGGGTKEKLSEGMQAMQNKIATIHNNIKILGGGDKRYYAITLKNDDGPAIILNETKHNTKEIRKLNITITKITNANKASVFSKTNERGGVVKKEFFEELQDYILGKIASESTTSTGSSAPTGTVDSGGNPPESPSNNRNENQVTTPEVTLLDDAIAILPKKITIPDKDSEGRYIIPELSGDYEFKGLNTRFNAFFWRNTEGGILEARIKGTAGIIDWHLRHVHADTGKVSDYFSAKGKGSLYTRKDAYKLAKVPPTFTAALNPFKAPLTVGKCEGLIAWFQTARDLKCTNGQTLYNVHSISWRRFMAEVKIQYQGKWIKKYLANRKKDPNLSFMKPTVPYYPDDGGLRRRLARAMDRM